MSDKKSYSRRDLLKGMGAVCGLSLVHEQIIDQIVGSFAQSAEAAPGMLPNYRYINFLTAGGIPRWYFDLPISPNGADGVVANKQVITSMKMDNNSAAGAYAHTKMGDFYLPLLWSYPIPLSKGGTGTLNGLASSGLFIRGVDQSLDGHEYNMMRQNAPVQGEMSYTGLFADVGDRAVPAATTTANPEHRSAQNKALVPFGFRNDMKVMSISFGSFKTANPKSFSRRDMAQRAIEAAVKSIQRTQGVHSPFMSSMKTNRDNAMDLLNSDFASIDQDYLALYDKYSALVNEALKITLPEVTSAAIYATARDTRFNIQANGGNLQASENTGDIRNGFAAIKANANLAHSFALSEYLITHNLSSSVATRTGFFSNFNVKDYYTFNTGTQKFDRYESANAYRDLITDVHNTGTFPALIMFVRHFHAYATCLNELVLVLKEKNLYDQTLIHTTSDFNRIPRIDGSGADHGYNGSATSLFSGRIKNTMVIGNISQKADGRGTWGLAADNSSLGDRKINLGNVASTICSMFDLPSPAKNDASLITKDASNSVVAQKDKPKNVA